MHPFWNSFFSSPLVFSGVGFGFMSYPVLWSGAGARMLGIERK
jgi:hypothetical protein